MRGKGMKAVVRNVRQGITPAYAGKSARNVGENCRAEDHPRICGEKGLPVL